MNQGFMLKKKVVKKQVICHLGKQKEVTVLQDDEGFIQAKQYYNHMERVREKAREAVGITL